jgi:hypothetical protein
MGNSKWWFWSSEPRLPGGEGTIHYVDHGREPRGGTRVHISSSSIIVYYRSSQRRYATEECISCGTEQQAEQRIYIYSY